MSNAFASNPSNNIDFDTTLAIPGLALKQLPPQRQVEPETTNVWGTAFAIIDMAGTLELVKDVIRVGKPEYLVTANLNYLMLVESYPQLIEVNRRAAAVIADGHPIVARSRFGVSHLPCRVAGSDLIVELAKLSAEHGYGIYLLGAAEGVAAKAADALRATVPGARIVGTYSPPFRPLSNEETAAMIDTVNQSGADILLVAFGQPKGELWIYEHLNQLRVPLSIQLGASFDFLAGTAKRAPERWQRLGLEWLYRAASDPKRLAPRYAANIAFLFRQIYNDIRSLFR